MHIGYHIMAWRRSAGVTQLDLAARAGLSRPYLSRLEKGKVDPALSIVRRLAVALNLGAGQLIDELPPERAMSRDEMDQLARGALRPGTTEARALPETRVLATMIRERRKALGLHNSRRRASSSSRSPDQLTGVNASRWLRASLGDAQWDALLRRIDKLASALTEES
jgi:transcriptional regulator with XRE-family HTH domain